ncbi:MULTISPECIES: DUF6387 family protein [Acinetobacter]|uniref:DUF6387 family protein n=1 Tax=Acinetobacter TaxID=469 RepID=UPI000F73E4F9|nr:DUF6387 family protein [Acinetobacter haemolyticus]RSN77559.1 hypothetical protein EA769_04290 [Acinetobacter haemolyticus]
MSFIKYKEDMPNWFKIDKYIDKVGNARVALLNLVYRRVLLLIINNRLKIEVVDSEEIYGQECILELKGYLKINRKISPFSNEEAKNKIIKNMFLNIAENNLLAFERESYEDSSMLNPINMCFNIYAHGQIESAKANTIKELTPIEIAEEYFSFPKPHRHIIKQHLCALSTIRCKDNEKELLDHEMWYDVGGKEEHFDDCRNSSFDFYIKNMKGKVFDKKPIIEVDLGCTNAVLLRNFEEWLIQKRKQLAINEISYEDELLDSDPKTLVKKINDYRLFAYIDLSLWEIISGHKIKKSVFAITLFPNGEKGESFFKTLESLTPRLLSKPYSQENRKLVSLYNLEKMEY